MTLVCSVEKGCLTCWMDCAWLAIKTKTQISEPTVEATSFELSQKYASNWLVTVGFSWCKETVHKLCRTPDPETAFNVMVKRRRAEAKVSTLSREDRRELVADKELDTFVKCSVVEAASRPGISPSALMKMRRVVTFKDDGSLKARLVVQGFTDQMLGKYRHRLQSHPVDLVKCS